MGLDKGDIEGVKNMSYWEYTAAVSIRADWYKTDDDPVEAPDFETFQRAQAAIMANPRMLN